MKTQISGGAGGAAGLEVALPRLRGRRGRPGGQRLLEDERLLAAMLLTPTVILLGLFIAYPFVMGVWLLAPRAPASATKGDVRRPCTNFAKAWDDSIFRVAFKNTFFYTFWATISGSCSGCGWPSS